MTAPASLLAMAISRATREELEAELLRLYEQVGRLEGELWQLKQDRKPG